MNVSSSTAQHEMDIWLYDCSFEQNSASAHGLDVFISSDNQPPQHSIFNAKCTFTTSSDDRIYWNTISCDQWISEHNTSSSSESSHIIFIIIIVSFAALVIILALIIICIVCKIKFLSNTHKFTDEIELVTRRLTNSDGFLSSGIKETYLNTELIVVPDPSNPETDVIQPVIEDRNT